MLFCKSILFLSLFFLTGIHARKDIPSVPYQPLKTPIRWEVQKNSTIRVDGESNINSFRCDIEAYYQADTIFCYDGGGISDAVKLKGSLKIDLFNFDCHSRMITSDMRKTLKADAYPKLVIHFMSLDRLPVFDGNTDIMKGWVNIELAGVTKKFEILYSFIKTGSSPILLNGGRTFHFSDFNLTPPRKLGGMIRIKDEFSVHFRLNLVRF